MVSSSLSNIWSFYIQVQNFLLEKRDNFVNIKDYRNVPVIGVQVNHNEIYLCVVSKSVNILKTICFL